MNLEAPLMVPGLVVAAVACAIQSVSRGEVCQNDIPASQIASVIVTVHSHSFSGFVSPSPSDQSSQ